MRRFDYFLILSAYFTLLPKGRVLSINLDELELLATDNQIESLCVGKNVSYVYINRVKYEIHTYDYDCDDHGFQLPSNPEFHTNTLSKLYTCINCEFADWTRKELLKVIELFPILYDSSFIDIYKRVRVNNFERVDPILQQIVNRTQQFVDILLNFQNVYRNAKDSTMDTQLSTTLLSLMFSVNVLNQNSDGTRFEDSWSTDISITRTVLEALNSIQNYTNLNCKLNLYYDNKTLFGFSMGNETSDKKSIDKFLHNIKPLQLNSEDSCRVDQILLTEMVDTTFYHINWKTDNGTANIKNVMENIKLTKDFSLIFWYQKYMITTFMKLLFEIIKTHYKNYEILSKDTTDFFINWIHSTEIHKNPYLSPELIECMSLLKIHDSITKYSEGNSLVETINKYMNSTPEILGIEEHTFVNSKMKDTIKYLNKFNKDFACFNRIFAYLSNKYDNIVFYESVYTNSDKIATLKKDVLTKSTKDESNIFSSSTIFIKDSEPFTADNEYKIVDDLYKNEGCKLFIGLYHYFFKFVIELDHAHLEKKSKTENEKQTQIAENDKKKTKTDSNVVKLDYYLLIKNGFDEIYTHLSTLLNGYQHFPHLKVILNILPHFNMKRDFFLEKYHDEIKRTLYVIMTELNTYGIENCNPPNYNFLLFNNMNFEIISQLSIVKKSINTSIDKLKSTRAITEQEWKSKLFPFIELIVYGENDFEKYEQITLNWKGERITKNRMCKWFKSTTLGPSLYAVNEFFLKFMFAVVFCEIFSIIKDQPAIDVNFDTQNFPKKFTSIIIEINSYVSFYHEKHTQSKTTKESVINEFKNVGVFIDIKQTHLPMISNLEFISKALLQIKNEIKLITLLNEALYHIEVLDDI